MGQTSCKTGKISDADWGKHETTGVRKDGNLWRKVEFGFGLHVDTKYEILVAFSVVLASRTETKELDGDKLFEETPLLAERCMNFSAGSRRRAAQGEAVGPVRHSSVARASREENNNPGYDPDKPDRSSTTTSIILREERRWS